MEQGRKKNRVRKLEKQGAYVVLMLLWLCSCAESRRLNVALEFAGSNRVELEKVLVHYKDSGEKYDAARFLIENMPHYFSYVDERLDSAKAAKASIINRGFLSAELEKKWGEFSCRGLHKVYDAKVIKADYLIENIDLAFSVWKGRPWGRMLSFEDFCELILPYRLADEPLEHWRKVYCNHFSPLLDSLYRGTDPVVAADSMYVILKKMNWNYNQDLNLPALGGLFMLDNPIGACKDGVQFIVYVMRSLGFPVAIDEYLYSPAYRYGHHWNTLQDTTGVYIPFWLLDTRVKRGKTDGRKKGKVYRSCYGLQTEKFAGLFSTEEVPAALRHPYVKDVTHEYFGTNTVDIEVNSHLCGKYVYPAVFRKEGWLPVDVAEHRNGKATIRNIEPGVTFIPLGNRDGYAREVGYPFQLTNAGIRSFEPDKQHVERVTLRRKYSLRRKIETYLKSVKGARIEASSIPTFEQAELLHTIERVDSPYMDRFVVPVNPSAPYRYIRYTSAEGEAIDLAELSFYNESDVKKQIEITACGGSGFNLEKEQSAIAQLNDGDYLTYYTSSMEGANVVFDLGRPKFVNQMIYSPHTDGNFIYKGDVYELYYQNGTEGWVSLGKKTAMESYLIYDNAPVGALLWLTNLSSGREEQVFYVENGEQVFVLNDK